MSDVDREKSATDLTFEYELDAPPDKVWRAISIPAFRERWLPESDLASAEPVVSTPGREVHYRLRDDAPPFLESVVTFRVEPSGEDRARLRIIHRLIGARLGPPTLLLANDNRRAQARAA